MPIRLFLSICFCLSLGAATGQNSFIDSCLTKLEHSPAASRAERLLACARFFIGKPYVGGVLEKSPERLVIEPDAPDCLTFVEYALALTLAAESDTPSCSFPRIVQQIRYRNGKIIDYASRLHYTLDWSRENQKTGRLSDVTASCPAAVSATKTINFMSTHAASYKALVGHPDLLRKIEKAERSLSALPFSYIPGSAIASCESEIRPGDVVLFVSAVSGLDIAHLGIACMEGGKLTFIHASSDARKVIVNPEPLAVYCGKMKRMTGIMLLRINELTD
jgi:cell wall-associated NlpC family hydrolase